MIEWLENHPLPCFYKLFFGIECPTCGFQRALILLLKGEFWESIKLYPPLLPTIALFCLIILQWIIQKPGWIAIKRFALLDLIIVLASYLLKLLN